MLPIVKMKISSNKLQSLSQSQLDAWVIQAEIQARSGGQLPDYIPGLTDAHPDWFAVQIRNVNGDIYTSGDMTLSFSLMSVIKPFVLLYLLEQLGAEKVFYHVGMLPSDRPFNSLEQLHVDGGFPRNPMLNSGAIALMSLLPGTDGSSRCENLRQWLNQKADCHLFLDELILASVRSLRNETNIKIARELANSGYLQASVAVTIDTYNQLCCLAGTVGDLASLGMLLVPFGDRVLAENCRLVKALMTTCGLYESSGSFAVQVGLPTKSGVSGALLSVVPREGAIACYSPPIDAAGNSIGGLFLLEQLALNLHLSVF